MKTFTSPFGQQPRTASAVLTAALPLTGANSLATDTPTNVLLATAGPEGSLLTRLWALPRGTITATVLFLFIRKATDAANYARFRDCELMPAYSAAATTLIPETSFTNYNEGTPLRLEAGDELRVAIAVASTPGIIFHAELTDF